jgi:fused signal recognition particle receptor
MFKFFKKKDKNQKDNHQSQEGKDALKSHAHLPNKQINDDLTPRNPNAVIGTEEKPVVQEVTAQNTVETIQNNTAVPQIDAEQPSLKPTEEQEQTKKEPQQNNINPVNNELDNKLEKSRNGFGKKMKNLFSFKKSIDDDLFEDIETTLLMADVGAKATLEIVDKTAKSVKRLKLGEAQAVYDALKSNLTELAQTVEKPLIIDTTKKPYVILVVGVNGVGKTTTIAKIARNFKQQGYSVMLAAGDTFRAAAVEQLKTWGQREDIPVIAQSTGSDSASVIFDAMSSAKARKIDILIADTAGRLHTQSNLMQELGKISRVIKKNDETAPHETLIVVDGGTGQNAISQIGEFNKTTKLTGIAITKLDGTAKGGVLFNLAKEFGIPVRFIGVGEKSSDLKPYIAKDFVEALLG